MKKMICMIPARLGSKRVPNKNLRFLGDKPLIEHIISAAKESGVFEKIYLNSEAEIFREIAERNGIEFYRRSDELASDTALNDDFSLDFIDSTGSEILIQLLATSPFLSAKEIRKFCNEMAEKDYDTLVSVKKEKIESLYKGEGVNFDRMAKTPPSQLLEPVYPYACGIMGWKSSKFRENMEKHGAAYHGGDGKTGYFELDGAATVDIDNEEDFVFAEAIYYGLKMKSENTAPKYYESKKGKEHSEVDVPTILKVDGVEHFDFEDENQVLQNYDEIVKANEKYSSWVKRIVNTESNSMCLISQMPGEGNRAHYHSDWNEWWFILDGEWEWNVEGEKKIVKKGDFVFMPKNTVHKITAAGTGPAVRMAVSRADVAHIYTEEA